MCSTPDRRGGGPFTPPMTRPQPSQSVAFSKDYPLMKNTSPEPQPYTLSDTSNLHGWRDNRQVLLAQSVQNRAFQVGRPKPPLALARSETVAIGLGAMEGASRPECSVCMDDFSDDGLKVPRSLFCGHSYCTGCLNKLLLKSLDTSPTITCPKCSRITDLAQRDSTILPKNYSLLDVIRETPNGSVASPPPREKPVSTVLRCEEHSDNLSSFCIKCGVLACSSCLLYGEHRDHNTKTLFVSDAAEKYRRKLCELLPEVRAQQKKMSVTLKEVLTMKESVEEMGGHLEQETDDTYDALIQLIVERKNMLKLEIKERTQLRLEALTTQSQDLKECIEKASAVHQTADSLLRGDDYSLLQRANLTMDEIEGVFLNPPPTTPKAQNDLKCEFSDEPAEEIATQVAAYGAVRPDVGVITRLYVKPYHDGFSIEWDRHSFTDNEGTTYYLQWVKGTEEFRPLHRGAAIKYNHKDDLEHGVPYKFRVQVRSPEAVGEWSQEVEAFKTAPDFHWHEAWRNVKIELSRSRLEASWTKGGAHNFWATFAGDKLFVKGKQTFAEKHYFEIEILDLGKNKSLKKLALGVISCRRSNAGQLPWQDGKFPIGQWDIPSWSFQPMLGVVHSPESHVEGRQYSNESTLTLGDKVGMLVELDEGRISYFINGRDLGPAFEGLEVESVLPCVSIRDKIRVLLRFPPPPYKQRKIKLSKLSSRGQIL